MTGAALMLVATQAQALPNSGQVVAGQAAITSGQNALTVNQSSNRAILNWQGFNIGSGETVNVVEPSVSSIELGVTGLPLCDNPLCSVRLRQWEGGRRGLLRLDIHGQL
jgi:large exoprotein involved in heme utilization and adhesion